MSSPAGRKTSRLVLLLVIAALIANRVAPARAQTPPAGTPAALRLPADARLPYASDPDERLTPPQQQDQAAGRPVPGTTIHFSSGPHTGNTTPYVEQSISQASGIDFARQGTRDDDKKFMVLAIADGVYLGLSNGRGGVGNWVAIEHDGGIDSEYWHLDDVSPQIEALEQQRKKNPGTPIRIPQGFPIGIAGRSGGQSAVHLHLELRQGADPTKGKLGTPVPWHGQTIDGWTVWMHQVSGKPGTGYNYQGVATSGETKADVPITLVGNRKALTHTGAAFDLPFEANFVTCGAGHTNCTVKSSTAGGTRADANTVFAMEDQSQGVELPSSNHLNTHAAPAGLDLIFVIDTTNSMGPYIDSAKAEATDLVNQIASAGENFRVALVDYRDFPEHTGIATDYPYKPRTAFTSDTRAIINAIQSLSILGGGDEPESLYTALVRAIRTEGLGSWRNGVTKAVIAITDAPAHDVDPVTGYTADTVVQTAESVDPAVVYGVAIGDDPGAAGALTALGRRTGGRLFTAGSASEFIDALKAAITTSATTPPPPVPPTPAASRAPIFPVTAGLIVGVLALGAVIFAMRRPRRAAFALAGPGGVVMPLREGTFTLGRDAGCDIRLEDSAVSRLHAQLTVSRDGAAIADLTSTHGTFVNDVRVDRAPLRPGDRIRLGETILSLQQMGG